MFMRTYASSWEKRKSFYRKSELQMFLLSSGGHIGASKRYKGARNVWANISETVGHKDLRLGQIVYILVFYNISFFDFFHWTVANLFFCCVTVNDLYGWRHGRVIQSGACFSKVPAPACSSFLWIEEVRTSKKVYQELFTSKKKEESKRKVPLVTWKMPKLVKRLAQKQEWCANHDASSRQVIVLKPLFCSLC